jgi:tetratricopeptide (TPR) repeat protein
MSAMIFLQRERNEITLEFLRKAERLQVSSLRYRATTYNNLACFYRRTGKVRTALNYLLSALELELKMDNTASLADTHLNLCAVLSQLDRHEDAIEHALLSVVMI